MRLIRETNCKAVFAVLTVLLLGCHVNKTIPGVSENSQTSKKVFVKGKWEKFRLGDIDGDKKRDWAKVYTPAYYGTKSDEDNGVILFDSCVDNNKCYNRISFSNGLPEIYQENTRWGKVEAIDDLDGDGVNEIVFQTNWFIGTHVTIYVYSFDKVTNQWVILADNWLYEKDSYKDRITKIDTTEFKLSIEYMDTIEHDIMTKDTIIKIKK